VEQGIFKIGRQRLAYEVDEPSSKTEPAKTKTAPPAKGKKTGVITPPQRADWQILQDLGQYAEALGLSEERSLFSDLANQVQSHCD
jgi:hypothetical protein